MAAVILGLIALPACYGTLWAFVPAAVGLLLGLSGLGSRRGKLALLGLLLCGVALSFCLVRSVILFQSRPTAPQELSSDEF